MIFRIDLTKAGKLNVARSRGSGEGGGPRRGPD